MASENGNTQGSALMWRVGEKMSARVIAAQPQIETHLGGLKLNRTQVIDYLLGKGLEAVGLGAVQPDSAEDDDLNGRR